MSGRRATLLTASVLAIALTVAGCASTQTGISDQLSRTWQAQIADVAEGAAAGDAPAALTQLNALQADIRQAAQAGEITDARAAAIQTAIDLVRADLDALAAVTDVPEPQPPSESPVPDSSVTSPEPDPASNGNGNGYGNGNGNGNGSDNGNGKGKGNGG